VNETTLFQRLLQAARQSQTHLEAIFRFAARALPLAELGGLAEKFRGGSADVQHEIVRLAAEAIIANPEAVRLYSPELADVLNDG
jgi:hypothetical protein